MARAGKEPAEDVKRAFRRAIDLVGLTVGELHMYKTRGVEARIVHATAGPQGCPQERFPVELVAAVGFDGTVSPIRINCSASDGDPLMEMFTAPRIQKCTCDVAELSLTLKEVWVARREVLARLEAGETPPVFAGKWNWCVHSSPELPDFD